jgi:hypothetical protein
MKRSKSEQRNGYETKTRVHTNLTTAYFAKVGEKSGSKLKRKAEMQNPGVDLDT